jgi:hypothetical protein
MQRPLRIQNESRKISSVSKEKEQRRLLTYMNTHPPNSRYREQLNSIKMDIARMEDELVDLEEELMDAQHI